MEFLQFGFPVGSPSSMYNHTSGEQFSDDIDHYLTTEIAHRALYGPYDHPPISGLHLSPMITRPQPTSTHRRVIIDLSWSLGQSVNAPLSSSIHVNFVCSLPYPTIDAMVQAAVAADNNGTCFIFKVDLEHAFGNLRVDPNDYALLGLGWHDRHYIDCGIPFGLKSGSFFANWQLMVSDT